MKHAIRFCLLAALAFQTGADVWEQAAQNGEQNRRSLLFCWRYLHGWLQFADPASGLIPRGIRNDFSQFYWNAKDCAADNYPFMVLSAWFTAPDLFNGPLRAMLHNEQRLCNRVDRLPDDWDFATADFRSPQPVMKDLIFGASEYVKDGLLPLTEWLGASPWSERMLALVDDIGLHADTDSEVGLLPSGSHEVNGEMMQSLSRLYWMTRAVKYRDFAYRIASYYLEHHLPTDEEHLGLDDHGCEVIGGLSEVYLIASREDPARHETWRPAMHKMLDRILEVGRDGKGLLYSHINPSTGQALTDDRTDNWGYNYNAFAVVASIDGVERYHEAIRHVMSNLLASKDYPWEGDGPDGIADSLEGGLNLLNRYPIAEAAQWADYMAERLLAKQKDTGIIEGWHGDGNSARTLIMYALWKSQGAYVQPWRADVRVGAAIDEEGYTCVEVSANHPYKGALRFDTPRHRENFGLPTDYPRLNQFPEWLAIGAEDTLEGDPEVTAAACRGGIPLQITREQTFRIRIKKTASAATQRNPQ